MEPYNIFYKVIYVTIKFDRSWECIFILLLLITFNFKQINLPGRVAQSVTCLAIDVSLSADPGVMSLIPARTHTFVEIDHAIMISKVILLPSPESFKKGCCQLQAKVCAESTG